MFANIGKIRKNHRLSRAVKGLWGPGANLPPALELLLCSVSLPDLCRSQCRALSLSRSWTLHTWAFKLLERLFLLWTGGRCSGTCAKTQCPAFWCDSQHEPPPISQDGRTHVWRQRRELCFVIRPTCQTPRHLPPLLRRNSFHLPHHHGCWALSRLLVYLQCFFNVPPRNKLSILPHRGDIWYPTAEIARCPLLERGVVEKLNLRRTWTCGGKRHGRIKVNEQQPWQGMGCAH